MSRFSLADELSAAFEGSGGEGGMRSLAEEFGFDLDEEQSIPDDVHSRGLEDLEFASASDGLDETDHFSSAHQLDLPDDEELCPREESADNIADSDRSEAPQLSRELELKPDLDPNVPSLSALSLADDMGSSRASRPSAQHHRPRHASLSSRATAGLALDPSDDDKDELGEQGGTPTRPGRGGRLRMASSTGHTRRVSSLTTGGRTSSAAGSSLYSPSHCLAVSEGQSNDLLSDGDHGNGDDDEDSVDGSLSAPKMLFGPPSARPNGTDDLTPPPLLELLRADDRSFPLEQATAALVKALEQAGREMEGRNRELEALGREVGRLLGEGIGFVSETADDWGMAEGGRSDRDLVPLEEEEGEASDSDGSFGSDCASDAERELLNGTLSSPGPSTPLVRRTLGRDLHASSPTFATTPPPSTSSPSRSSAIPPTPSGPASSVSPPLVALGTLTSSVLASLGAIRDQSQITLSASADFGRRVRSARATLAGLKSEEEAVDRARRGVAEWEEEVGRRRVAREQDIRERVEQEMGGFGRAMDDFEARTRAIRDDHNAFLVSAAAG